MSVDPWTHVLETFFDLSKVTSTLSECDSRWKVEIHGFKEEMYEWLDDTLKTWKCLKLDTGTWIFEDKKIAEKFITLFNLKWAQ